MSLQATTSRRGCCCGGRPSLPPRRALRHTSYPTRPCVRVEALSRDDNAELKQAATLAAGVLSCLITAHPAHAEHVWRPRRHRRRLGERYYDTWADPIVDKLEEEERQRQEAKRKAAEAARKAHEEKLARKRALREEKKRQKEDKLRAEQNVRKAKEVLLSVVTFPRTVGEFVRDNIGFANLAIFLALVAFLLKFVLGRPLMALWRAITGGGWSPRGRGKWVMDRSLGGKMVWVPEQPEVPAAGGAVAGGAVKGLGMEREAGSPLSMAAGTRAMKEEDFEVLTKVAAAAGAAAAKRATAPGVQAGASEAAPEWWKEEEGGRGLSDADKEQKQAAAEKVLRSLEQAKVSGLDYSFASLVKLHGICQDGGVTVTPSTVGGRDALYRTAVEGAIRGSTNPNIHGAALGGWTPQQLVVGLAKDLGLSQERALKITRSCIAAEMRTRLVDIVTALKKDDQTTVLVSLLELASLQAGLPLLTASSPEVEMIASSLNSRASMEQRQFILEVAAQVEPSEVGVFAALLGFDPEFVVPKVIQSLKEQRGLVDDSE